MDNNKRNLKRVVYTSSPDRGLEHLLKMWPDVKKAVPDAELHVCYGWQIFDQMHRDNPGAMEWKKKIIDTMKSEGIIDHERLPQPELAELLETCGIWAYPTHFTEINCISALKAQYYSVEPVVVNYAALKETVQFGRKIEGDIYDEEVQNEFKKQLVESLQNPMNEEKRKEMSDWAKQWEWSKIAKQWHKEFKEV